MVVPLTVKLPPTVRFPVIVPPARGSLFVIAVLEALIALASIPSSFVPSAAISLPSTVPDTVMLPVTSTP